MLTTVPVGGRPTALAHRTGPMWAGALAHGRSHRGGTLTLVTPRPVSLGRSGVLRLRRAAAVHGPGLRHARHVRAQRRRRRPAARARPRAQRSRRRPTAAGRTRSGCARDPLLGRHAVRAGDFRRAIERCSASGSPGSRLLRGHRRRRGLRKLRPTATSRAGSSPTTRRDGRLPPHRARPRVPLRADRARLRRASPAGTPDHDTGSTGSRHRALPDRPRRPPRSVSPATPSSASGHTPPSRTEIPTRSSGDPCHRRRPP